MVTLTDITPQNQFIEATFEGPTIRGFPNLESFARSVFEACQKHQCTKVLVNLYEVEYEISSDSFAEHELAMSLSQGQARSIQWAFILPKTIHSDAIPLINAMRNPGVRFMVFLNRDDAVTWLENTHFPSEP